MVLTLKQNKAVAVLAMSLIQMEMVDKSSLNAMARADSLKRTHVCTKHKSKNKVHGKEEGGGLMGDKMESSLHR